MLAVQERRRHLVRCAVGGVALLLMCASSSAEDDPFCELKCTEYGLRTGACSCGESSPATHEAPLLPPSTSVPVTCPAAGNAVIPAGNCLGQMTQNYNGKVNQFNANVASTNAWAEQQKSILRDACQLMQQIISQNGLPYPLPAACGQL